MTNHYLEILGLKPGATEQEIKTAYRRLAKKYHPDTSAEPDAEARFIEITEAYRCLTEAEPAFYPEVAANDYSAYEAEYAARQEQARAYARQKAEEAAQYRFLVLRRFFRILTPLVLAAGLFNLLLVLDYAIPSRHYDEKIQKVYRIFSTTGRGGGQSWSYDAIEFEHFTIRAGRGKAVDQQVSERGSIVTTPWLGTIKYVTLQINQEEQQLKPAYGLYQVFVYLIPAILLCSFFYFWLPTQSDHKLTVGIIALFAFIIQCFVF
ncbi:MAG: DnaJ domain-containing protein [Cyclobacteriaceae bacterium]